MLYGSGIYIVSKDDMASFLEEVKQQYKDIDWFLPEEYIYRHFDNRDTHKLVFLGNGMLSKEFNKHKVTQISWQNPKPYEQALDSARHMVKKGCKYSNNHWQVYRKFGEIDSLYNILVSSYDKEFAFEAFLNKLKEIGAEILSATELKNKFIACESYEKVRIYIKPKEKDNKDAEDEIKNRFEETKKAERVKCEELQKVTARYFHEAISLNEIPTEMEEYGDLFDDIDGEILEDIFGRLWN